MQIVAMDPLPEPLDGVLDFWTLVDAASPEENDCELDVHDHRHCCASPVARRASGKCAMYSIDACLGTRDGMLVHPDLCLDRGCASCTSRRCRTAVRCSTT